MLRIGFEEDLSRRAPRESRIYGYWTLEVADRPQCQVNFPPGWLGRSGLGGLTLSRDEAVARGVFGAPTCFVGDAMFFGQDRLDFVREALLAAA